MTSTVEMTTRGGEAKTLISFEDMLLPAPMAKMVLPNLDTVKDMEYREGDVLLCSYPKSGTHWVGHLIMELSRKSPEEQEQLKLEILEMGSPDKLKTLSPRLLGTHLRPKRIQNALQNEKCKIVLVVRNPKDVAVSLFHHLRSSAGFTNNQTWEEFFTSLLQGLVPGGPYLNYLDEWEAPIKESKIAGKQGNIELFYFEDLKQNPLENIRRLSRHIGYEKTDAELKQVLEACSIGNLREKVNKNKENIPKLLQDKDGNSVIFRKGDVGDWKTHFTVAQNEAFENLIDSRLKNSIFQFKYEL